MLLASLITIFLLMAFIYHIKHKSNRRQLHSMSNGHKANGHKTNGHKKIHKQHLSYQHHGHSPFHCVETHHPQSCCQAVKDIEGKRFLSAEAPTLPLQKCDNPNCHCDYIHHEDRRCDDRRNDTGIQHDLYGQGGETEKRNNFKHGRRKTD